MNVQTNPQHLCLLLPKASIYCASMVGKQALSDVLQRIQSRTDSVQLGYSGNTCWEHMLRLWEQQGTQVQTDNHCSQSIWFRENTQSKSCLTKYRFSPCACSIHCWAPCYISCLCRQDQTINSEN